MICYDLQTLRKAYLAGERCKFLFFWGHTPPADGRINESCLSQWWMCRFTVDGVSYCCAEQYMMAQKARMFGDAMMLEAIMDASQPKQMKAFGRSVRDFDKARWDEACFALVREGNLAKFGQNGELRAYLASTKGSILVEASPRDRIWGIGMGRQNPGAQNPMEWRGRNLLGFALTQAREQLEGDVGR